MFMNVTFFGGYDMIIFIVPKKTKTKKKNKKQNTEGNFPDTRSHRGNFFLDASARAPHAPAPRLKGRCVGPTGLALFINYVLPPKKFTILSLFIFISDHKFYTIHI